MCVILDRKDYLGKGRIFSKRIESRTDLGERREPRINQTWDILICSTWSGRAMCVPSRIITQCKVSVTLKERVCLKANLINHNWYMWGKGDWYELSLSILAYVSSIKGVPRIPLWLPLANWAPTWSMKGLLALIIKQNTYKGSISRSNLFVSCSRGRKEMPGINYL